MSTTLEVILKTAGFTEGATAIKKVGDEATATNTKLKTTASTVDQVSKNSTSLGSKLKAAGGSLAQIGTAASTTALSVVNLQRSYRDLEDSQIAVDKTTRRVSLAQEAYRKATDAVTKALSTNGKNSAQYKQALLDQQQALAKVNIAIKDQGEAVERQGDINQDFWLSLGTTALSTSSTVVSALEKIGGEKGLGGILTKLKGLGAGGFGGLGGLAGALGPLTLALGAAALAFATYQRALEKAAAGGKELELAKNAKNLAQELEHIKKAGEEFKLQPGKNPIDFLASLGGAGAITNAAIDYLTNAKVKSAELATETDNLTKARDRLAKANADPDLTEWTTKEGNAARLEKQHAEEALKLAEAKEKLIPPTEKMTTAQAAQNKVIIEANKGFNIASTNVTTLATQFGALNAKVQETKFPTADVLLFDKALSQWGSTAKTISGQILTQQPALDPTDWFLGSWAEASDSFDQGFQDMVKTQADAAAKIKKDQQDAAAATKAAWDAAFSAQVSGIDKMIAAYGRSHPTAKGFSPLGDQSQFLKAQAQMDKLLSGAVTKAPAYAKTFVTSFIGQISQNMTPVAAQVFQPIIDYVNAHKNDAPDVFMKGFEEAVGKNSPTLATAMAGILDKGMVQPATTAADTTSKAITTGLGKVDITPLEEKMKLGAQAAGLITKGINKIPKKVTTTVNITANLAQANAKWAAFVRKVQMTTLQVKIAGTSVNIKKGSQAGAYGGPKQHGYQSTVHRPTMFMAGEGGRPEDVTVRPRGSVQRGGSAGGGGSTHITVSFEPQEFAQFIRYRINDNQGVVK